MDWIRGIGSRSGLPPHPTSRPSTFSIGSRSYLSDTLSRRQTSVAEGLGLIFRKLAMQIINYVVTLP